MVGFLIGSNIVFGFVNAYIVLLYDGDLFNLSVACGCWFVSGLLIGQSVTAKQFYV